MIDFKNKIYEGSEKRKSLYDCRIPKGAKAVIVFIHGYKGYKDWGAWNLMENYFVNDSYGFIKFNLSHNGGTIENPIDFNDLEAFGRNTYSNELNDLKTIIDETERLIKMELEMDLPIYLIGHSRGGGIAVIGSANDSRIKKVVSLAGISNISGRWPDKEGLEEWKANGVRYVQNSRTNQSMPHYYSFYEDYLKNKEMLDIQKSAENLKTPFLQIHGDMDQAVSISEGQSLAEWTNTRLSIIKGAEHTFGARQPWTDEKMPEEMEIAMNICLEFFEES